MNFTQIVNYFISLLMVCSPFSALPALLNLTQGMSIKEKKNTGLIAGIAVGVILITMTWIGSSFLSVLGITIPAFQITGGIVVFLLAFSMLNAQVSRIKQTAEDQKEAQKKDSVAIVPLAIPITAGPGAISTVIIANGTHPGITNQVYMTICAALVALLIGITLYFAVNIEKFLGQTGINIFNRIAGLILAAMAIQMLAKGAIGLLTILW
ncbi:MAG: MarC family protein [Candidatus Rhabdochlamydia sp.]